MMIKNFDQLANSPLRKQALLIADAGLSAVRTEARTLSLKDISAALLSVGGKNAVIKALVSKGATVEELRTIIKHVSNISQFGEIEMIFDASREIAPTTMYDAAFILERFGALDAVGLATLELEMESKEKHKVVLISLRDVFIAMKNKAQDLGFTVKTWNEELKSPAGKINSHECWLWTGVFPEKRNLDVVLAAFPRMEADEVCVSIGQSTPEFPDAAGAIADVRTQSLAKKLGLDPEVYIENDDSYHFFESTGDLIFTSVSQKNQIDLFLCLRE